MLKKETFEREVYDEENTIKASEMEIEVLPVWKWLLT